MEKEGCKSEAMGWASSESSTKPGGNKRLVKCECGVISPVRVASTKRNSGRRFRGCGRFGDGESCNFFEWVDVEIGEDSWNELAAKLKSCEDEVERGVRKITMLEMQLKTAVEVGERLTEENWKLKSELALRKEMRKKCSKTKCVVICGFLVLLWIGTIIALV